MLPFCLKSKVIGLKRKKKGKVRGYKETKLDSNLVFNGNMQIC